MTGFRGLGAAAFAAAALLSAAAAAAWTECAILTTDYGAFGGVSIMERYEPWSVTPDVAAVGGDPAARWHDGLLYVVNRGGASNIQVLDPQQEYATVRQFSVGAERNPQDIAFDAAGFAYVTCYDEALLLRIDPQTGEILADWSTAPFADADGLPETAWLEAVDGLLYVACQRLDRANWYLPTDYSCLAIFDPAAGAWVDADAGQTGLQGIVLTGTNPYAQLEADRPGHRLRVCSAGVWGLLDGGVETVDCAARTSLGFEVTEQDLGGDLLDLATAANGWRFAIVSDPTFRTAVVRYVPADGAVEVVDQAAGYDHADLAFDGTFMIYVADRTLADHGVRVFDAVGGAELTDAPLPVGLPPFRVVLPVTGQTAVPALPAAGLRLLPPWPNPCNPATTIHVKTAPGQEVRLAVVDLRGRRVRSVVVTADTAGEARWWFDGSDGAGRNLPAGVYRIVAVAGAALAAGSVTLVR